MLECRAIIISAAMLMVFVNIRSGLSRAAVDSSQKSLCRIATAEALRIQL